MTASVMSVSLAPEAVAPEATPDPVEPAQEAPVDGASEQTQTLEAAPIEGDVDANYSKVVRKVEQMNRDSDLVRRVGERGLSLVNVMWEDTGRAQGSALGPNISDLTLQVQYRDGEGAVDRTALMPVIRFPNFTDKTGDVPASRFFIRTGNHRSSGDGSLTTVRLEDAIRNLRTLLSEPKELKGHGNLHALRDSHFLVSAQAVFLPIPEQGKATFNPVVFNYQSAPESPSVLTMLVTRQGTSVTVIENRNEGAVGAWGQELYFNEEGQRARFTAERRSNVAARIEAQGGPSSEDDESALGAGADVLFLVQVPLKHKNLGYLGGLSGSYSGGAFGFGGLGLSGSGSGGGGLGMGRASNVEQAVLGHGETLGPFNETSGLRLVRDAKFPIRITVQFYKATSNGVVSDDDLDKIQRTIDGVYEHADAVGSLVLPQDDRRRPTAWQTVPNEWFPW